MKKHKGIIFKAKSKISQSIRNINKPKMKRIEINEELTIVVNEKTNKGDVTEMLNYGNRLRDLEGLEPMTIEDVLSTRAFWELVILMNIEDPLDDIDYSDYSLDNIDYKKMIKLFPLMIESENYMSLYLILKVGSILDNWLKSEIYNAMYNRKI